MDLPENSERGGLVAQAGFLKLTSTDFATSPIHRGAWILKNLYNERIEPPADVLINEPDIRGEVGIGQCRGTGEKRTCYRATQCGAV